MDEELLSTERLKLNECCTKHYCIEQLPNDPDACIDTAILWITSVKNISLSIFSIRFLRFAINLKTFHAMIVDKICRNIRGCEPTSLFSILCDSLPSDYVVDKLSPEIPSVRIGLEALIYNFVSTTPRNAYKIHDVLKFWRRFLKAVAASEKCDSTELPKLLKETHMLLLHSLDKGLPSNIVYSLLRLYHKATELIFYGDWRFTLRPSPSSVAISDQLRADLISLASSASLSRFISLENSEDIFDFGSRCSRLVVYTIARLLLASDDIQSGLADHLAFSEAEIIELFQDDDVLLFRMLITLLLKENKAIKDDPTNDLKLASAHSLFTCLLESIDYDRYTLIDWLVSPETDCLTYLLAYTKRLAAAAAADARWCLPPDWEKENGDRIGEFLTGLVKSLRTLSASGSLPFSPNALLVQINRAIKALKSD